MTPYQPVHSLYHPFYCNIGLIDSSGGDAGDSGGDTGGAVPDVVEPASEQAVRPKSNVSALNLFDQLASWAAISDATARPTSRGLRISTMP